MSSSEYRPADGHDAVQTAAPLRGAAGTRYPIGMAGALTTLCGLAWVLFFLHTETGMSFWLQDSLGAWISGLTGLEPSLAPASPNIRVIHLVFAICMATFAFPLFRISPTKVVPVYDWAFLVVSVCAAAYLIAFRYDIETRIGLLLDTDFVAAIAGLVALALAVQRATGLPLLLVAGTATVLGMFGGNWLSTGALQWDFDTSEQALRRYWLGSAGAFGEPFQVAISLIFPLALFYGIWMKSGAADCLGNVAASWLGSKRGGGSKAAIATVALTGSCAPSARCARALNGEVCAPIMERNGFQPAAAQRIMSTAALQAQLLPPVMAIAIVLIADQARLPIADVAISALLPAVIGYVALWVAAHGLAVREGLDGSPPEKAGVVGGLLLILPVAFLVAQVLRGGGPPGVVLLQAAGVAAVVAATHKPVKALFRLEPVSIGTAFVSGLVDLRDGIVLAARIMAPVALASAAAGLLIAAVAQTGLGDWFLEATETLGERHVLYGFAAAGLCALVLGMGMPTAPAYIVTATLVIPAITPLADGAGLLVPVIAVHMFVLYLTIAASDPPPVASLLPIVVLPFLFLFNPDLLLVDVDPVRLPLVVLAAGLGAIALGATIHRCLATPNRLWETVAFAAIAFSLFHPGFWLDRAQAPVSHEDPARIFVVASGLPEDATLDLTLGGPGTDGATKTIYVSVPLGASGTGARRLEDAGLTVFLDGRRAIVQQPFPDTPFAHLSDQFDFSGAGRVEVTSVLLPAEGRLPKDLFAGPPALLLVFIWWLQRRRRRKTASSAAT